MSKKDRFQLVGKTIAGTFRVDEVVAEGGFGIVYRAYHMHFRSPVALKCLKIPAELSADERQTFLEQFRSEAEIQFRLSAALPNIVRPLHVDAVHTDRGEFVPLMALEWLDGQSFERIIEQRSYAEEAPLTLSEAMELIGPAAHALDEAHNFEFGNERLSVVHRDIKPDNLFVTEIGGKRCVKLLDFGISKVRRAATQLAGHFSQTSGQAPFSPAYGAPEQWVPKRFGQTGPWTDVWGLALTLVEIIKGDAVIIGDHQAMMGTALDPKVRPSPRAEGVLVSDEVESVFLKALSVDPRYRYQSIRSFWEALGAALAIGQENRFDETPSGRRIALPRMKAPTPWTPPHQRVASEGEQAHLPPMLAPAPLENTPDSQLESPAEFYPSNPDSDLHPVPPAPTTWSHLDLEIPPFFDAEEREELESRGQTERRPTQRRRPSHPGSLDLELAPTSSYPIAIDIDDSPEPPALEAPAPLSTAANSDNEVYVPPALGGFSLPAGMSSGAPIADTANLRTNNEHTVAPSAPAAPLAVPRAQARRASPPHGAPVPPAQGTARTQAAPQNRAPAAQGAAPPRGAAPTSGPAPARPNALLPQSGAARSSAVPSSGQRPTPPPAPSMRAKAQPAAPSSGTPLTGRPPPPPPRRSSGAQKVEAPAQRGAGQNAAKSPALPRAPAQPAPPKGQAPAKAAVTPEAQPTVDRPPRPEPSSPLTLTPPRRRHSTGS